MELHFEGFRLDKLMASLVASGWYIIYVYVTLWVLYLIMLFAFSGNKTCYIPIVAHVAIQESPVTIKTYCGPYGLLQSSAILTRSKL